MRSRFAACVVVSLLMVVPAWAAAVDGKWVAQVAAGPGGGESTITFVFKADGSRLTGTLNNSQAPGDVEIKEGQITGDDLSFSLTRNIGGTDLKVLWKGKLSGDEIKFTRSVQGGGPGGGGATEITAKRSN